MGSYMYGIHVLSLYIGFDKSPHVPAVHMLKGKRGDILRVPGVMYRRCRTTLPFKYAICTIMYVSKSTHTKGLLRPMCKQATLCTRIYHYPVVVLEESPICQVVT